MQLWETITPSRWSPLLCYAVCFAASVHLERNARRKGALHYPDRAVEQLRYKCSALSALRLAISPEAASGIALEEILLCVFHLAAHDNFGTSLEPDANPFSPALADLDALDFYGFSSANSAHWEALRTLVGQCNGLNSLRLFGLPWILSR